MSSRAGQSAERLERVIEKDADFLKSASDALRLRKTPVDVLRDAPESVIRTALTLYQDMRVRLLEIEKVQTVLRKRHGNREPKNTLRAKLLADLDVQIRTITGELAKRSAAVAAVHDAPQAVTPADRWLRDEEDSVAFTVKARLLEDLDYRPAGEAKQAASSPVADHQERRIERSGRCFTLITMRGPAPALDAILPSLKIREHDILERYSATEIRGVLTHLRPISEQDLAQVIRRFIATGFPDVKCLFIGIRTPDQIDDVFLSSLEQMLHEMQPGECRSSNIASLL